MKVYYNEQYGVFSCFEAARALYCKDRPCSLCKFRRYVERDIGCVDWVKENPDKAAEIVGFRIIDIPNEMLEGRTLYIKFRCVRCGHEYYLSKKTAKESGATRCNYCDDCIRRAFEILSIAEGEKHEHNKTRPYRHGEKRV